MKIRFIIPIILMLFVLNGFSIPDSLNYESVSYRGVYQGKDLFIMNPMLGEGENYCVNKVTVNGAIFDDELNSSAFKIALDHMGLDYGEAYEVILTYDGNCSPTLVNPEVLKPLSTFEITDFSLGYNDQLTFTTTNESGVLVFVIEEYRWDRWVEAGEIKGKGGPGDNTYTLRVYPFSGENRYRIYQMDHLYRKFYSDEFVVDYQSEPVEVLTNLRRVRREIEFSQKTRYIIINEYGEEVMSGFDEVIDVRELDRGNYFLNYENDYKRFRKR